MKFSCFGTKENPAVLLMHGMCQDWRSLYDCLGGLSERYYLIIPAMDGFYEGSGPWTSFPDECEQIEKYVKENHGGNLYGIYGASQGTIVLAELIARGNIKVEKAFFDGTYVAHQGVLSGLIMYRLFASAKKNGGRFPEFMNYVMGRMGLTEEDMVLLKYMYWDADNDSIRRNMIENYTYRVKPEIGKTGTHLTLCCGSKEPFALKSHRIIKHCLPQAEELVLEGYGHGQMVYLHGEDLVRLIEKTWDRE